MSMTEISLLCMNDAVKKNLKPNPEKVIFRSLELPFMGHKITTEGL